MPSVLMCPPSYFGIEYSINPWMDVSKQADWSLAMRQWTDLAEAYDKSGIEVQLIPGVPKAPDMVFTANAGLVSGGRVSLSKFLHQERTPEEPRLKKWFQRNEYKVKQPSLPFEGEGDCLRYKDLLLAGNGFRSKEGAYDQVSSWLKMDHVPIRLIDPRFYHLDLALGVVNNSIIWYPGAFDDDSKEKIRKLGAKRYCELSEKQALSFCCNLFSCKDCVFIPSSSIIPKSFPSSNITKINVSEFMKSGGGVKCMTLSLD